MVAPPSTPPPLFGTGPLPGSEALTAFIARLRERVLRYLQPRHDVQEQLDHLRHVADRTRWLYYSEQQRINPGASVRISHRHNDVIEACVLSHDMGKWIPRDELQALFPDDQAALDAIFQEMQLSQNQIELFLLGLRRRFNLEKDGYTPEYDAAHHLVSAYILLTDRSLTFAQLEAAERAQLIRMVIGHQFGSYFKRSLLALSLTDTEVTTGMLVDSARSDRLEGDTLSSVFHDADISDLLFVGSLELRPYREEAYHAGGLVKILMINFANLIYDAPHAPRTVEDCFRSCQNTVNSACLEFLTPTAIEHGYQWRKQASRFLEKLRQPAVAEKISAALLMDRRSAPERLAAARLMVYLFARDFLKDSGNDS